MYFRFQGSVCLLVACLTAGIACDSQHAFGEGPATHELPQVEWEVRIEAALRAKGEWEFVDAPLNEVCSAIQEKLGIEVVLDVKALEDFGIDTGTPITRSLRGVSNRSFLRLMLRDLELTYMLRLGALWITTPERAEAQLVTTVYPVGDLVEQDLNSREPVLDYDSLAQAIMSVIAPDEWDQVGGPGVINGIYGSLAVSQTAEIHEEVSALLQAYRAIVDNEQDTNVSRQTSFMLGQKAQKSIHAALDRALTVEIEDVALTQAMEFVGQAMNIPIVIDTRALEDFGIDPATPINAKFKETPLRFALDRMLNEMELTYTIRDEVLFITTPEVVEAQLLIGLYPVRDLVQGTAASPGDRLGMNVDFDSLIRAITSTIDPDSWDEVGGPGAIEPLVRAPTFVVSQTQENHEKIAELLTKLRAAKKVEAARVAAKEDVDPTALIVRSYPIHPMFNGLDEIVKLIVRASEPGTWDDEAGTFVQGLGMSIVAKHNASGHRQVEKLLSQLGVWYPSRFNARSRKQGLGGGPPQAGVDAQPAAPGAGVSPGGFF